jgi:hypothetical protein
MRGREHSTLGVLTDMSDMAELVITATIQRHTGRRKVCGQATPYILHVSAGRCLTNDGSERS